jgi:hypothetical protein
LPGRKEISSWFPDGSPKPRKTGRLTVGRNLTSTSTSVQDNFEATEIEDFDFGARWLPSGEDVSQVTEELSLLNDVTQQRSADHD